MKKAAKKTVKRKPTMRFRQTLFWDVNPKTIDPQKHARYIIERIMDFGNDNEVRWMWKTYDRPLLRDVVRKSRTMFQISRNFWLLMLDPKALKKIDRQGLKSRL